MKFKANVQNTAPMSPREEVEMKYKRSRANLLLVTIVSVVNLFTMALNYSYFLFSARMPAFILEVILSEVPEGETIPFTDLLIPIVIGIIMTVPYLLCWIFSKKRPGWMVAALVFFAIDCILLLTMYYISAVIVDLLFHAWVMFYLITGVINGFKLKKMPEDEPLPEFGAEGETPAEDGFNTFNEADFTYTADNTAPAEETAPAEAETAEEPVAARSFDEIMAENNKDGE
jgi:hypothetical protein